MTGNRRDRHRRGQRGFTLMETTIAMILMMIVGLGGASLFAYAIKYNSGADDRALALALAQQRLEEFRALPFNDASLDVTAATTENTTHGGRPFRIKKTITADATGTIKTITLEVTPMSTTVGNTNSTWSRAAVRVMTQRATTAVGPYL